MVAEFEAGLRVRNRSDSRALEGMKLARAQGRLRGKQPKLTATQEAHLVDRHRTGGHTSAEVFSVAGSTVYRALRRAEHEAPARDAA